MIATHARFSEANWYGDMPEVTVGGVGGIGSWLAVLLGRIGCDMFIHDMDIVDETNMAGQLYRKDSIGTSKESAVASNVRSLCESVGIEQMGEFNENSFCCPITFSAFDNMKARKIMFEKWKSNPERELFIDGRMLMESGQVFSVTVGREEEYEKHLFDDSKISDQPCSAKATSHSGAFISSIMVASLTNYLSNQKIGVNVREVPFKVDYNFQLMMFES